MKHSSGFWCRFHLFVTGMLSHQVQPETEVSVLSGFPGGQGDFPYQITFLAGALPGVSPLGGKGLRRQFIHLLISTANNTQIYAKYVPPFL